MTYRPPRIQRPSKRALRANALWLQGDVAGLREMAAQPPRKRGPQKEGLVNDAIAKAARLFGVIAWRNRRGMLPLPNGGKLPFGIGPHGASDFIGYTPVTITAEMVGRQVAVATFIESKTNEGRVASHQQAFIDEVRAHGAIAGVARCGEDVRTIIQEWEHAKT